MILFEIKSCIDRLIHPLPNAYCVSAECVSNCWRMRIPLPTDAVSVADRCVSSGSAIRICGQLDTHPPARRYGERSNGILIRRRSSTGTTSHAIRQAKNCSRTFCELFANSFMSVLAETIDRLIKWFLHAQEVRLYCMECAFAKGHLSQNIVRQKCGCGLPEIYILFA